MHVGKLGAEHTLAGLPLKGFFEAGVVYSYYTGYSSANKTQYPSMTSFILTLGFHIFQR
jgi:hypothetical protein